MVDNVTNTIVIDSHGGVTRIQKGNTSTVFSDAEPAAEFGDVSSGYALPLVASMALAAVTAAGVGLVGSVGAPELAAMVAADFLLGFSAT